MTGMLDDAQVSRLDQAIRLSEQLGDCIAKAGRTIKALSLKRVTLEEKMIRFYFHDLSRLLAQIIAELHLKMKIDGLEELSTKTLPELHQLADEALGQLEEILKMIEYDLNFLEQYFEHSFYGKLSNECLFLERAQSILSQLKESQS